MASLREQQLRHIALHLKMEYIPTDEWGLYNLLRDFKLFRKGRRRKIFNLLHIQDSMLELDVHIFDYQYARGKNKRKYIQTVFFVQSKKLGLPHFFMKPENFFHKIAEQLGMQDIDFVSNPQFSENYLLQGEDEEYIRATMHEDFLHFFEIERNWYLEGVNYYLILYKKNRLLPPNQVKKFYNKGLDIYKMLQLEA